MKCIVCMLVVGATPLLACGNSEGAATGLGLGIAVAPLALPGIDYACYDLAIVGPGGPVVSLGDRTRSYLDGDGGTICSWQYGNSRGGDITYIAPCDADDGDNDSPAQATNTVTVWFDGLYADPNGDHDPDEGTDIGGWQDPCPNGCSLPALCRENSDTEVAFNFTVMRNASQGFFDIAVNFDDIFCSAKLDCVDELLHRPGGARDLTAVLGFACTSGADTCLYVDAVTLTCDTGTWTIDPTLGPGNVAEDSPVLFGAAVYSGDEAFTAFQKRYWNVALGLDEAAFAAAQNCTLSWSASASESALTALTTPDNATYPRVVWSRNIIVDGQLACGAHALNEVMPGESVAAVATSYTTTDAPYTFDHSNCEEPVVPDGPRWMIGAMELVAYDRESGTFTVRDATTASPGNAVVASSWEITPTDFFDNGSFVSGQDGGYDSVNTAPLSGAGASFTFSSRIGWDGYAACDWPLLDYRFDSTERSFSGLFLNQVYYPFSAPVFVWRDGLPTGDGALFQAEVAAALTAAGLPYDEVVLGDAFATTASYVLVNIRGLSPPPGQTLFPSVLLWFDRIWPATQGYPGDDFGMTRFAPPTGCATNGTAIDPIQAFRVTLTSQDTHGETVTTRALFWVAHNEKGFVHVGGDLSAAGSTLTLSAHAQGELDHAPPGTTFNRIWLDRDGDGTPDAEDPSGVFTHDFGSPGTHRGFLSADDDPFWGMGFGEIFSGFYYFVP